MKRPLAPGWDLPPRDMVEALARAHAGMPTLVIAQARRVERMTKTQRLALLHAEHAGLGALMMWKFAANPSASSQVVRRVAMTKRSRGPEAPPARPLPAVPPARGRAAALGAPQGCRRRAQRAGPALAAGNAAGRPPGARAVSRPAAVIIIRLARHPGHGNRGWVWWATARPDDDEYECYETSEHLNERGALYQARAFCRWRGWLVRKIDRPGGAR